MTVPAQGNRADVTLHVVPSSAPSGTLISIQA